MAQHPEQQVARLVHLGGKEADGFGDRLVDGLVEADDVVQVGGVGLTCVHPHAEDAGASARYSATIWLMLKPLFARSTACVCAAVSGASINFGALPGICRPVRRHRSPWPFVLGVASLVALAGSLYGAFSQGVLSCGLFGLLAATVWNRVLSRRRQSSTPERPSSSAQFRQPVSQSIITCRSAANALLKPCPLMLACSFTTARHVTLVSSPNRVIAVFSAATALCRAHLSSWRRYAAPSSLPILTIGLTVGCSLWQRQARLLVVSSLGLRAPTR